MTAEYDHWDGGAADEGAGPRYCPRCRRDRVNDRDLCPDCGERLIPQGYCAVCEAYWHLPIGTDCPKHEISLEEGPGPVPQTGLAPGSRWVTVRKFADSLAAEAPRLRLEAEGIPTFIEGQHMGSRSMYHVATGGVKLQVPEPLLTDARILLDQTWLASTDDHDELEDAWDELAPEPGRRRRQVMRVVILAILFGPTALWLIGALLRAVR